MVRLNVAPKFTEKTHEDAPAARMSAEQALRRSVMSCLLWEREFYEDGEDVAKRIVRLAGSVSAEALANLTVEARSKFNLRHVPLLLLSAAAKHKKLSAQTVTDTIQRADELAELLVIHAAVNEVPASKIKGILPAQMKRGLADAFAKFDEYALAKYDRAGAVRLRDVLFLTHAKAKDAKQEALWKRLIAGELTSPDTWEVALSGGADKKEAFERLLHDGKLGYMALLRNLRNMTGANVNIDLIRTALLARKGADRVLPFRYVAAARACPQMEPFIDQALSEAISEMAPLPGKTVILVDVSISMDAKLSERSDLTRLDAAAALASIIHGDIRTFSFSSGNVHYYGDRWNGQPILVECPARRGMAGIDAIIRSQEHGGTFLGQAVKEANAIPHDRLIVITDEQSNDPVPAPIAANAYMVNVASAQNGVGYCRWTHIDGFSEQIIRFIHENERTRIS